MCPWMDHETTPSNMLHGASGGPGRQELRGIAKAVEEGREELPTSRRQIDRTYFENFDSVATSMSLPTSDGEFVWEFCDPARLLQLSLAKCVPLQETFQRGLQTHRCDVASPWRLVVGFDEFCPGKQFSIEHSKK